MNARALSLGLFLAAVFSLDGAVIITKLHSFSGPDGAYPSAVLCQGADGNFYGTTEFGGADYSGTNQYGGATGSGTVFKMTAEGFVTSLASFGGTNGWHLGDGLVQGRNDGSFYGTTGNGGITNQANFLYGMGTVFRVSPSGDLTTVVVFNGTNGAIPTGSLIQDSNGDFFGTTTYGGTNYLSSTNSRRGTGTIFKISGNGGILLLHSFSEYIRDTNAPPYFTNKTYYTNLDGALPPRGLIQGSDGNLYGATQYGGANEHGTVFKITPQGALTTLASFGGTNSFGETNGWNPGGRLLQANDGVLYGTTHAGPNDFSTIFKITTNGAFTKLYVFTNNVLIDPSGLVQGSDGNFYGTTYHGGASGHGSVFQMTPGGVVTTLYSFRGGEDGSRPLAELAKGVPGTYYGTTQYGGVTNSSPEGYGTVFRVSIIPNPVFQAVNQTNGVLTFSWSAIPGQRYQAQSNTNLNPTNWVNLGGNLVASEHVLSASDVILPSPHKFYRILVLP